MSTGAPSNEKQALAEELAEARALIEDGEYEAALDRLVSAWQCARAQHDSDAVEEVRMLAQDVAGRAVGRSERQRADGIALALGRDRAALAITLYSPSPVGAERREHPRAVRDRPAAVAPGAVAGIDEKQASGREVLGPSRPWRPGVGTWSLLVVLAWLVASVVVSEDIWTTGNDWLLSRRVLILLAVLFFALAAGLFWALGVLLFLASRRLFHRGKP